MINKKDKFKQIFLTLFILIPTTIVSLFIFDLLSNLDLNKLVNIKSQNIIVLNNQVLEKDVKNITFNINYPNNTNSKYTASF